MSFAYQARTNPDRVEVTEHGAWVATFTIGCYAVTLTGPTRTFSETFKKGGTTHTVTVTHSKWVRVAPGPVDESIDERWLACALAANEAGTPDALAIAMQYIKGAPPVLLGDLQIAGDASLGPPLHYHVAFPLRSSTSSLPRTLSSTGLTRCASKPALSER